MKIFKNNPSIDDLNCESGFTLVYFYEEYIIIGEHASNFENFMYSFCESYPVNDNVPDFVSLDDILNRAFLIHNDCKKIAIYDSNARVICEKRSTK